MVKVIIVIVKDLEIVIAQEKAEGKRILALSPSRFHRSWFSNTIHVVEYVLITQ